jgi:hypothetical protein
MSGHCYLDRATKEESTDGTRTRDARDVSPHETGRGDDGKTMVRSDPVLARPTGRNETRVSRHPLPLYRLGSDSLPDSPSRNFPKIGTCNSETTG